MVQLLVWYTTVRTKFICGENKSKLLATERIIFDEPETGETLGHIYTRTDVLIQTYMPDWSI